MRGDRQTEKHDNDDEDDDDAKGADLMKRYAMKTAPKITYLVGSKAIEL